MLDKKTESQQIAVSQKLEILDELLKPEVQESLTNLIEQLPKLVEFTTLLTKTYDFVKVLATDEVLKDDTVTAVNEIVSPVISKTKLIAQNIIEAKERAEESEETIGIFGLLKILKDPQVQSLLRFIDSYVQVSAEKNN